VPRLTLLGVLAFLAIPIPAAQGSAAATCSKHAAVSAVLASSLPQYYKDEAKHKYGPNEGLEQVTCRDFTSDGKVDMEATFFSGGTAGDVAWVVFRNTGSGWTLALARLKLYKLSLAFHGSHIVETQPVYRKNDGNCCPTGGFDHRRYHWNGSRFAVARAWHDKRLAG
jgi:hypothetical protein